MPWCDAPDSEAFIERLRNCTRIVCPFCLRIIVGSEAPPDVRSEWKPLWLILCDGQTQPPVSCKSGGAEPVCSLKQAVKYSTAFWSMSSGRNYLDAARLSLEFQGLCLKLRIWLVGVDSG